MLKVSIIIPVYNVHPYLRDCVESVEIQTLTNREVILVDDGSTDGSGELCDELAKEYADIIVVHKANRGLSSARNVGIERSRGTYIIFLDSDDFWIGQDSLEKIVLSAQSIGADIVRGEYKRVDENGRDLSISHKCKPLKLHNCLLSTKDMFSDVISGEYFSWLFLIKRDVLSTLRFNEEQLFQEDVDFAIRLFCRELKCLYCPTVFYSYRIRPGSLIASYDSKKLGFAFLLADTFDSFSDIASVVDLKTVYRKNSVLMYYIALHTLASDYFNKERCNIIKELHLKDLQRRTRHRVIKYHIYEKITLACILPPKFGVVLIRCKWALSKFLTILS